MCDVPDQQSEPVVGVEAFRAENEELRAENTVLRQRVDVLTGEILDLKRRLGINSRTSSMPPSSDSPGAAAEATRSRAERRAEQRAARKDDARRRGKQPGAPGQNLKRSEQPDEVREHEPDRCTSCGNDLARADEEGYETRQVFDTPDPRLICTEHRSIRRRCSCGKLSSGAFPLEARAPACYGPNVRSQALYLLHAQHLSVERTAEAMSEMLGVDVSTGFVASLLPEAAGKLRRSGFLEVLKALLIRAEVINVDETFDQVRTTRWYFHVAATELYTYLFASSTRAKSAPDQAGVLGLFRGVMVHDRLAMYFNYGDAAHGICAAHLLRDLASVAAVDAQKPWAEAMSDLLREMIVATDSARAAGRTRLRPRQLKAFLARYDEIVEQGLLANPEPPSWRKRSRYDTDSFNLATALKKLKTEATRFAKDLIVPATNNEAERSLRMVKLHAKVSGVFQSESHAEYFGEIRSYIGTARKHGVGALHVLGLLFRNDVWMPPATT